MSGIKRTGLVFILAVISIAALLLSACDGGTTISTPLTTTATETSGLSEAQLRQLTVDMVAALETVDSYTFDIDMDMNTAVTGGADAGEMTMTLTIGGAKDLLSKALRTNVNMSIDSDDPELSGMQDVTMEMYMLGDWVYVKMALPGMGEQWIKMPADQQVREQFDLDIVGEQFDLLSSPVEIKLLREETLDGVECYVLSVVPDTAALLEWVQEQDSSGTVDLDNAKDMADSIKELNYIVWVTKDSDLPQRMTIDMSLEVTAEQASNGADFDSMAMDVSLDMTVSDYNQPVDIVPPPEAENAIQMPGG